MDDRIRNAQQRAIQYWFVDGLAEIGAGILCLLLAVFFLSWEAMEKSRWSLFYLLGTGLVVAVGLRLIIQKIKQRLTYPQTGYTAPPGGFENKRLAWMAAGFTVLLLGLNVYLSLRGSTTMLWSAGLAGLVFAFVFAWIGFTTGLRRFAFLALISLGLGAVLGFLGIGYWTGVAILTGWIGVILLLNGIWGFKEYRRQTGSSAG
jgi:hypothetical protein